MDLVLGVIRVQMDRMVVHGQQTEEVIVTLEDCLSRPMLVRVTNSEILKIEAKLLSHVMIHNRTSPSTAVKDQLAQALQSFTINQAVLTFLDFG